ncbi:hypothetical protein ACSVDE_18960 [Pseudalkalibacillus sp. Hm43]|uniref:hypothetical protein n=1 Tax=Pseudalkalibacillus sp. Hm43 TaxID=3450742 RepID=UPI003F438B78
MNRKVIHTLFVMGLILLLTACGGDEQSSTEENNNKEETTDESPDQQSDDNKDTKKEKQGDYEVTLSGEIEIEKKTITVNGETNLLPGSDIYILGHAFQGAIIGSSPKAQVAEDGSFTLKTKFPDDYDAPLRLEIRFTPEFQDDQIEEHYTKTGEKLKGDFVRLHKESEGLYKKISYMAYIEDPTKNQTLKIESPNFEKPSDQGDPKVRLEPKVEKKTDDYIIITGKSNLVEGTHIEAYTEIPGYMVRGYTDKVRVEPDGSYRLIIPNPEQQKELKGKIPDYQINLQVKKYSQWDNFVEAYGKEAEHFQGPHLKENSHNGDKSIEVVLPIKVEK